MANYAKTHIGNESRVELHEVLGLTGAEVSVNNLPAGAGVPFVHAHKENEEIYGVLEGAGSVTIDGEEIELAAGDWLRKTASHPGRLHAKEAEARFVGSGNKSQDSYNKNTSNSGR